ncbi:MAG: ABC transporter ATP-binding protein [Actinobacteria bacterium]|nr:ABC transporter ATP-binding protein [Actinomycetota bacterium]
MLEIGNLEVVYNKVVLVLRGVSLRVEDGQAVALLGSNGAGKTTLLRAVTGLLSIHDGEITKGAVEWNGERLEGLAPTEIVRRGVAQVMERRRIFPDLTVEENLLAGAYQRRDGEVRADVEAQLERFPVLAGRRSSAAGYLSGGEQQMLAIARALMARPKLLLLDEPSLGLAPKLVEEVAGVIGSVNAEGVAVLLVEQNAAMALDVADHGYVLETGRVVHDGTAEELREDRDVKDFYLGLGAEGRKSFREVKHYHRRKRWLS